MYQRKLYSTMILIKLGFRKGSLQPGNMEVKRCCVYQTLSVFLV